MLTRKGGFGIGTIIAIAISLIIIGALWGLAGNATGKAEVTADTTLTPREHLEALAQCPTQCQGKPLTTECTFKHYEHGTEDEEGEERTVPCSVLDLDTYLEE